MLSLYGTAIGAAVLFLSINVGIGSYPVISYVSVSFSNDLLGSSSAMLFTVIFFVFSCTLCLTPAELLEAKAQNISM